MAINRTKTEREEGLAKLSRLYLTGRTQTEIGKQLGISQGQVSKDLRTLQKRWQVASVAAIDEAKARELAKIDELERTYWRAWRRSCQDEEVRVAEKQTGADGEKGKTRKTTRGQAGSAAFLSGVQWCIEQRCKILGIVVKTAGDVNVRVENSLTFAGMKIEQFEQLPIEEQIRLLQS